MAESLAPLRPRPRRPGGGAGRLLPALAVALLAIAAGTAPGAAQHVVPVTRADLAFLDGSLRPRIEEALDRAERLGTAEAVGELGVALHAYERFDLAAACYAAARKLAPTTFEWTYLHGTALMQQGEAEAAARALRDAVALDPRSVAARLRLGDVLLDLGRLTESAAAYREVLRDRPASALAAYGLGRVLSAQGSAEAVTHLEQAVERAPAFGPALYALAQAYQAAGDRDRAAPLFERHRQARRLAPHVEEDPLERIAAARSGPFEDLARGRELLRQGRHKDAVEVLQRAAAARPDLVQAQVNLVAAHAARGDAEQAEAAYRRAAALSPKLPELHYNLGVLRLSQGRSAEAIDAFRAALEGNPSHADAHNNLAYLLGQAGRSGEAIEHLRAALAAAPAHRDAHFNLARLLLAAKAGDEALQHFARAAEAQDEKTALYLYYFADACARLGRLADAERHALAAKSRAQAYGQVELVERIDGDLRRLRAAMETHK